MVNSGSLAVEICWRVWGTPENLNEFRVLAALLHGSIPVLGVIQTCNAARCKKAEETIGQKYNDRICYARRP